LRAAEKEGRLTGQIFLIVHGGESGGVDPNPGGGVVAKPQLTNDKPLLLDDAGCRRRR